MTKEAYKPKRGEQIRVCKRHVNYVKLCPQCNTPVQGEAHIDLARKLRVITPVYRKLVVYKGKSYKKPQEVAETVNKPEEAVC